MFLSNQSKVGDCVSQYVLVHSDDELYHYGVMGMKWGVRRDRKLATKYKMKALKYHEKGNKNAEASNKNKAKLYSDVASKGERILNKGDKVAKGEKKAFIKSRNKEVMSKGTAKEIARRSAGIAAKTNGLAGASLAAFHGAGIATAKAIGGKYLASGLLSYSVAGNLAAAPVAAMAVSSVASAGFVAAGVAGVALGGKLIYDVATRNKNPKPKKKHK